MDEEADKPNAQVRLDVRGKAFQVEDGGDEPNAQEHLEDEADEPGAQLRLDVDEVDDPNAQVHLNEDEVYYRNAQMHLIEDEVVDPNAQVHLNEDEVDDPNAQVPLDVDEVNDPNAQVNLNEDEVDDPNANDEKLNAVEMKGADTKPNLMSGIFLTVGKGCYMQILVLTFALSFSVGSSAFVEVPNNTVLQWKSRASIHMACKSDCQCNLRWFMNKNNDSEKEDLYNGYALNEDASSYCSITFNEPGDYYLNLLNEPDAAQTYICFEPGTLAEASADLILLSDLIYSDSSTHDAVNLTCSIEFRGNWAPAMEWKEYSIHGENVLTVGVNTVTVPNQRVTSTLVMPVQEGSRNYTCATKFDISGKPLHTSATNTPDGSRDFMFIKSEDEMKTKSIVTLGTAVAISIGTVIAATLTIGIMYKMRGRKEAKIAMEGIDVEEFPLKVGL